MKVKTKPLVFANHIETTEDIKQYLSIFYEENGPEGLIAALGHVAKKKGMTEVARTCGVSRQSLYRTLGEDGNPNFITVSKVIEALGCKIKIVA